MSEHPMIHSIDEVKPATAVAFIKGTADIASHEDFQKAIKDIDAHAAKNIVLDIRQLDFLTSLAVGEMISLSKSKKRLGGKVVLAGPNQYVMSVFTAARLSTVIPIYATVDEAVAVFE
jgi:anti-anti-sigma factor